MHLYSWYSNHTLVYIYSDSIFTPIGKSTNYYSLCGFKLACIVLPIAQSKPSVLESCLHLDVVYLKMHIGIYHSNKKLSMLSFFLARWLLFTSREMELWIFFFSWPC